MEGEVVKKPRWKRTRRLVLGLGLLAIAGRVALPFCLPSILESLAEDVGLALRYDDMDLSLLGGRVELWGLELALLEVPGDENPRLVDLDYLAFDMDTSKLLGGELSIFRAELGRVDVYARRGLDGTWQAADLFAGDGGVVQPEPVIEPDVPEVVDLALPFSIRRLGIADLKIHVDDSFEQRQTRFDAELSLVNFGSEGAELQLEASIPGALTALRLGGKLAQKVFAQDTGSVCHTAELSMDLLGLNPRVLGPWLEQFGISGLAHDVKAYGRLDLGLSPGKLPGALDFKFDVENARCVVDGEVQAQLEGLHGVVGLGGARLGIEPIELRGLRVDAQLLENGDFGLLGFGFSSAGEKPPAEPIDEVAAASASIHFGGFSVADSGFQIEDRRVGTNLSLGLEQLELGSFVLGGEANEPVPLRLELIAPGIFERATLAGDLGIEAPGASADERRFGAGLTLDVVGIEPTALEPYLKAAGLMCLLGQARLAGRVDAWVQTDSEGLAGQLDLADWALVNGDEAALFGLDHLAVHGLRAGATALSVESVLVEGLGLDVVRTGQGDLELAGLRLGAVPAGDSNQVASKPEAAAMGLRFGDVRLTGTRLSWLDETVSEPVLWQSERLDLRIEDFDSGSSEAARVSAQVELGGVVEFLGLSGSLKLGSGSTVAALELETRGLNMTAFDSLLEPLGARGELRDGLLVGGLIARLEQGEASTASLELHDWALSSGDAELWGLDHLFVGPVDLVPADDGGLALGAVELDGLRLLVERDSGGDLAVLGLRFLASSTPGAAVSEAEPAQAAGAPLPKLRSDGLALAGIEVDWRDRGVEPAVETTLSVQLDVAPFVSSELALNLRASATGLVDELALQLNVDLLTDGFHSRGQLGLQGIDGSALGSYLPPGVKSTLISGSVSLPFDLATERRPNDQLSVDAEVGPFVFQDGDGELARFERAALHVSSLSSAGILAEEIILAGLSLDVESLVGGGLAVPGFELRPTAVEVVEEVDSANSSVPVEPVAHAVYFDQQSRFELGSLEVDLAHLGWRDLSQPEGEPLDLRLRLRNRKPWVRNLNEDENGELDQPISTPALELELTGHALPLTDSIAVDAALRPFVADPEIGLNWLIRGLSGVGLTKSLPALKGSLDGSGMTAGEFSGQLESSLSVRRRGPADFNFGAGFGALIELRELALRAEPGGRVLLGFDELLADLSNHAPRSGRTHFGSIELVKPIGLVGREAGGLRALGLLLLDQEPGAEAAEVVGSAPVVVQDSSGELLIDRIMISGADIELRDDSVEPPARIPIDDLDVVISGFTTRALTEALPLQVEVFARGGAIEMDARDESGNLLMGMASAASDLLTLEDDEFEREERRVFSALLASGNLSLFPAPTGWLQIELAGVELPNFRGLAMESGVDLGDGLVDLEVDLRFLGERGVAVTTSTTAAYLSLSEPPGGPISTYLKLPAPLDTVLFLLRNEDGEQEVDLNFKLGADGAENIASAVATTLALVIGEAIASSPMRLVGGVLDMTGLMDDEPIELPDEIFGVSFLAGSVEAPEGLLKEIEPVLELMRAEPSLHVEVQHFFGKADLQRLGQLANPDPAACVEMSFALRHERDTLRGQRDQVAAELRTAYALGDRTEVERLLWELANLDDGLGRIEDTLDGVLELLRPGAERRSERRTKAAALIVAQQRLEAVHAAIVGQPISSIGARLRLSRARFGEPAFEGGGRVFVIPVL